MYLQHFEKKEGPPGKRVNVDSLGLEDWEPLVCVFPGCRSKCYFLMFEEIISIRIMHDYGCLTRSKLPYLPRDMP